MNEIAEPQATNEDLTGTAADVFDDTTTETPPTPEPSPPPPPTLTPEQIRESVSAGVRDAQPAPPPRQYTPQELNQLFNVWEPPEDFVERIRQGGADGVKAMMELRDGLSRQFGTLLQYQMEVVKRDMLDQMRPAMTYAQEAAAAKDRDAFFSENEDLREHEQLTQTVFDSLKSQGYRAPDKATAYKVLADRTRALLSGGANGSGAAPTGGARRQTTTQTKRPAQLSSGSQAGGGGPSAPAVPFPGAEVFM